MTLNTGDGGAAEGTFAFLELHFTYPIAPAGNDELATIMAIRILPWIFGDIVQIDILIPEKKLSLISYRFNFIISPGGSLLFSGVMERRP